MAVGGGVGLDFLVKVEACNSSYISMDFYSNVFRRDVTEAACTTGQATIPWAKLKTSHVTRVMRQLASTSPPRAGGWAPVFSDGLRRRRVLVTKINGLSLFSSRGKPRALPRDPRHARCGQKCASRFAPRIELP